MPRLRKSAKPVKCVYVVSGLIDLRERVTDENEKETLRLAIEIIDGAIDKYLYCSAYSFRVGTDEACCARCEHFTPVCNYRGYGICAKRNNYDMRSQYVCAKFTPKTITDVRQEENQD